MQFDLNHDFHNSVEEILFLFFSKEADVSVDSRLFEENGEFICETRVVSGNAAFGRTSIKKSAANKQTLANTVKRSAFLAAKQLSSMPTPWGISTGIRPAKLALRRFEAGDTFEQTVKRLEDEYWMSGKKARLAAEVALREDGILKTCRDNAVSIYVGVPFCPTRCAYCSFVSEAMAHNKKFMPIYADAVKREIEAAARLIKESNWCVESIYFGGGTPTTLAAADLDGIIKELKSSIDLSNLREFTVEAGRPDTVSEENLTMLKENGVSRICINPQTMHQTTLDKIGRSHTVEQFADAFRMARAAGFDDINSDLIAGLPDENIQMFRQTLDALLELDPEGVTVHTLYMKRAARLNDEFEKLRFADNAEEMVDAAYRKLTGAGLGAYYMYKQKNTLGNLENVGYAKAGHECLYNINIMEERASVIAIGAGGSTKLVKGDRIERVFNPKNASDYIGRIDEIVEKKLDIINYFKEEM